MKVVVLLSGLFFLYYPSQQNDLTRQKLKGNVRSLSYCQCPVKQDGSIDSGWCTIYSFLYDERGNQVEDHDYVGVSLSSGQSKQERSHVYKYDAHGNQAEVYEYKADGSLAQLVMYKYDQAGNRVARYNFRPDGALWYRSEFSYDEKRNKTACSKYNADSVLLEQYVYKYDDKNNLCEEQYYLAGRTGTRDSTGNSSRKLVHAKTYTYDNEGKMLSEKTNSAGVKKPFETNYLYLTYDAKGNWLKQTIMDNGTPANVTGRVIEYYE